MYTITNQNHLKSSPLDMIPKTLQSKTKNFLLLEFLLLPPALPLKNVPIQEPLSAMCHSLSNSACCTNAAVALLI